MVKAVNRLGLVLPLLICAGCGGYTVRFQVQDVINAPTDESSRKRLDIDIVALTKKDMDRHPELANGGMRSDAWFKSRRGEAGAANISDISAKQIFALRGRGPEYQGYSSDDRILGDAVSSVRDGGANLITHKISPSGAKAFVIFGRFHDGRGGDASVSPLVISPLPEWDREVVIQVGAQKLTWMNQKN